MRDDDMYPKYCRHNLPIYHTTCPGCRDERRCREKKIYDEYWNRIRIPLEFKKYINDRFHFHFTDPSESSPQKIKIRQDDKFIKLKKSSSQEELKKAYYKYAKQFHPDKPSGDTKLFQKLSQLYDLLKLSLPV